MFLRLTTVVTMREANGPFHINSNNSKDYDDDEKRISSSEDLDLGSSIVCTV